MNRSWVAAVARALLLAVALTGCGRQAGPRRAILVLLDTARPDRFSAYGYERETTPHLDSLARRGVVFLNHYSQATETRSAMPLLLHSRYFGTPLYPRHPEVPLFDPEELFLGPEPESVSLPAALSRAGFATAMISAHPWFTADSALAAEFDEFRDLSAEVTDRKAEPIPTAARAVDRAIEWLGARRERDLFLHLHLMDTHFPHPYGEDARRFFPAAEVDQVDLSKFDRRRRPIVPPNELEKRYLDAVYDGSLRYADREFGRLIDALAEDGLLEQTLIAITSDHGEHLYEQPDRFTHGGPWYERVARVPLILFFPPTLRPGRVASLTENVDLVPTMLGLLEVELPVGKQLDGVDLSRILRRELAPKEHAFGRTGLRDHRYKVLFDQPPERLLSADNPAVSELSGELYDLDADPGESRDLWSERPDLVDGLLEVYRRRMKAPFARHQRARGAEPPRSAFAISAGDFLTDRRIGFVRVGRTRADRQRRAVGNWFRVRHLWLVSLVARDGARPLTIRFPLPSGAYRLSAAILGSARLTSQGLAQPVTLRGPTPGARILGPPYRQAPIELRECGLARVSDDTFQATLELTEDSPGFVLRYLSFTPAGAGREQTTAEQDLREEQLRALGYLD